MQFSSGNQTRLRAKLKEIILRPGIVLVVIVLVAAALIVRHYGIAARGGPDDGLLHLAGATTLLKDGSYPIIQRPPLYSLLLAVLAVTQAIVPAETTAIAQELGSVTWFDVAIPLLEPGYLHAVLIVHVLLWSATILLMIATLRALGVRWRWIYVAVLLAFVPSSWRLTGIVSEIILCAFLVMTGIYALVLALKTPAAGRCTVYLAMAGVAFALLGLAKPTFQLLSIAVILCMARIFWQNGRAAVSRFVLTLLISWLILVGGWSARNNAQYGFLGVSGVTGVALSTRTALYLERAQASYPQEAAVFRDLRNQTFIDSADKNDVVYWGARASNWLMTNRGMSYVEANRFLTAFNLNAIRAAPLNYLDTVLGSLIGFHFPGVNAEWPTISRLLWSVIEFLLITAFTLLSLFWVSLRVLARMGRLTIAWITTDTIIALLLVLFWYTALISCAVDVGKPEHRMAIQVVIPATVILIQCRLSLSA